MLFIVYDIQFITFKIEAMRVSALQKKREQQQYKKRCPRNHYPVPETPCHTD